MCGRPVPHYICGPAPAAEKYKRTHQQVAVQLQVDNTTRCCQAVANGDVDIAVVGGAIPSALEHLVQVGAGLVNLRIKSEPCMLAQAAASPPMRASRGHRAAAALLGACCQLCRGGCQGGQHSHSAVCHSQAMCQSPAWYCTGMSEVTAQLHLANLYKGQAVLSAHI